MENKVNQKLQELIGFRNRRVKITGVAIFSIIPSSSDSQEVLVKPELSYRMGDINKTGEAMAASILTMGETAEEIWKDKLGGFRETLYETDRYWLYLLPIQDKDIILVKAEKLDQDGNGLGFLKQEVLNKIKDIRDLLYTEDLPDSQSYNDDKHQREEQIHTQLADITEFNGRDPGRMGQKTRTKYPTNN